VASSTRAELWFVKTFHEQLKGHLYCK
jgi:hypothetical protein